MNGNNKWDDPEPTFELSIQGQEFIGFGGQGFQVIDRDGDPFSNDPVLLAPNSVFVARLEELLFTTYDIGPFDPNIVMTAEWLDPTYTGAEITFSHRPVPEPATIAVLGLGLLPLLRRRKKARR